MRSDPILPTRRHVMATMAAVVARPITPAAQSDVIEPGLVAAIEAMHAAIPPSRMERRLEK